MIWLHNTDVTGNISELIVTLYFIKNRRKQDYLSYQNSTNFFLYNQITNLIF